MSAIDDVARDLDGLDLTRDAPLAKKTTFGIGGPADLLVNAQRDEDVVKVLEVCRDRDVPFFLLGGGSNILIGDRGVRGVVLTLGGDLRTIAIKDEGNRIEVGVATTFSRLTRTALDLGWPSAIGWIGTPGQVGGALIMNAGSREGEVGDVVKSVTVAIAGQGLVTLDREACQFSYRRSEFPPGSVLTRAILQCDVHRSEEPAELDRMAKEKLAARHRTQPKKRSAGSIFKNPEGDYAGRLIEAAGLKGLKRGNAQISDVHANFVINLGGARAADVEWLAKRAQVDVKDKFDVELQWEVKRVGEFEDVTL